MRRTAYPSRIKPNQVNKNSRELGQSKATVRRVLVSSSWFRERRRICELVTEHSASS